MTKEHFQKLMSDSAETIIRLVCDGDYQSKIGFPRSEITVEQMLGQYDDIKAWKGDEA